MELAASRWANQMSERLLEEFFRRVAISRNAPGSLYAEVQASRVSIDAEARKQWLVRAAASLATCGARDAAGIALRIMQMSFAGIDCNVPGRAEGLTRHLGDGAAESHAAAWALGWMSRQRHDHRRTEFPGWQASPGQMNSLIAEASRPNCDSETLRWIANIVFDQPNPAATEPLLARLSTSPANTRASILKALGAIGDPEGRAVARACLRDPEESVRRAALGALSGTCDDKTDRALMFESLDERFRALDPLKPVAARQIKTAAKQLKLSENDVRQRYERLAERFGLTVKPASPRGAARKAKASARKQKPA